MEDWKSLIDQAMQKETADLIAAHATYGQAVRVALSEAQMLLGDLEAAKIIENTQRDLNVALVNELAIIFNELNLDTNDIIDVASTKWNFQDFRPGLVGGHCIGVDPYYLTFKSKSVGYYPELVLAGRRINENMSKWIIEKLVLKLIAEGIQVRNAETLVLEQYSSQIKEAVQTMLEQEDPLAGDPLGGEDAPPDPAGDEEAEEGGQRACCAC